MRIYSNIIDFYQLIFRSRSSTIIQVSAVSCLQGGRPGPLYFLLHLTPSLCGPARSLLAGAAAAAASCQLPPADFSQKLV